MLHSTDHLEKLDEYFTERIQLAEYKYRSDIPLSAQEFNYLTNFHVSRELTPDQLKQAASNLFAKNCFDQITITFEPTSEGVMLFFDLIGAWRFGGLKVTGIWVGKEWYKQFYLMEPGDRFDQDKHLHSLEKIKQASRQDGFFDVAIKATQIKDAARKIITVQAHIDRGWRYAIESQQLDLQIDETIPHLQVKKLEKQLRKKMIKINALTKYSRPTLEAYAKNIKQFLSKRGFLLINIDLQEQVIKKSKSVRICWHITIGKKRDFVFFGNHFFSYGQLCEKLLQFGRSAWIVPATILADELKDMYKNKGYWNVVVAASDESSRAIFAITEGKRAIISEIKIDGATIMSSKKMVRKCCGLIKRHHYFDQSLFDQSCEKIIDQYLARGYLKAKIEAYDFILQKDNVYCLQIRIKEGEPTVIDSVEIPGYTQFEKQGPFLALTKKNKPVHYDAAEIATQRKWLADQLRKKGYLFCAIHSQIVEDAESNKKKLVWSIDPGNQIAFGKMIVQGVSHFPFDRILREIQFKEGDVWDSQKIRSSFSRLKSKEIFDSVSFTPLSMPKTNYARPILLKLHNDDPFEVRARAGLEFQHIRQYQTLAGLTYKVGGSFLVKNPSNNGDYFRFDGDVARSHREIHLKYFYPWLFGAPIGALFHTYAVRYEQPGFIGTKNNIYTIFDHGFLLGLRYKGEHLEVGFNSGYQIGRTKIGDDIATKKQAAALACAIDFNPRLLDKRIPFFFIEPTIMIDHLDNNANPHRGMFTLISMRGMFPTEQIYRDAYFLRLLVEHSFFVPIAQAVAAFRVRFGHIFHRCFADIMPNERFYLGGAHSIRSYETDLAPPLGCFIDDNGKKNIVPRGGKTMLNINMELRLPEWRRIGLVLFQDMGLLSGDNFDGFSSRNTVGGLGFGVRYFTPIGPLRFDVAFKWRRHIEQEMRYNWYLTFGQAF